MVRRGMVAGLAGLGAAALLKLTGGAKPESAEAGATPLVYAGAPSDPAMVNTAWNRTEFNLAEGSSVTLLQLNASGIGSGGSRDALVTYAGDNGGRGVVVTGSGKN